jgi:hypothetical protein
MEDSGTLVNDVLDMLEDIDSIEEERRAARIFLKGLVNGH